ncbi:MAG: hypothetical protein WAT53_01065, partial [Nitrosomonas sp.]
MAKPGSFLSRGGHHVQIGNGLLFFCLIAVLFALFAREVAANNIIKAARYYAGPEHTRITLES